MTQHSKEHYRIHFAVMAIEASAKLMGISPTEMRRRLDRIDFMDGYVFEHYDTLHTQSLDYVAQDLVGALRDWEPKLIDA